MKMLDKKEIEILKEKRRQEIREEAEKIGMKIGMVVVGKIPGHKPDCECIDCLTRPEPFYTHPEIHKRFVECIFKAVKG